MRITLDDLITLPHIKAPSLIGDGLLPQHGIMQVVGKTGIGKSVIVADMAMSLVLGEPLFNAYRKRNTSQKGEPYFPVHKECKVLYFDAEVGISGLKNRMEALMQTRLHSKGIKLGSRFEFITEHVDPLVLLTKGNNQLGFMNIRSIIGDCRPTGDLPYVVVFDPMGNFHEIDENDSNMRIVFNRVKQLQSEFGFAAVIPHHESDKLVMSPVGPMVRSGTTKSRGHSSIPQNMDTMIGLDRDTYENGIADIRIEWSKTRHCEPPPPGMLLVDYSRMFVDWYGPLQGQGLKNRLAKRTEYVAQHPPKNPPEE